jgi:ABC-2 type transport system permease protein
VESRELISRFDASANFVVVASATSIAEVNDYLDEGRAWVALDIPADYGERIRRGEQAVVQVVADGSDANSTNVALGYAGSLVAGYAREVGAEHGRGLAAPLVGVDVRVWFNPRLESRDFMIPGILALLLLVVTTNLSSMAIVREKELGTLEQLNVTPLARWELITGKLLPYALLGMRSSGSRCRCAAASCCCSPCVPCTCSPPWASACSCRRSPPRSSRR